MAEAESTAVLSVGEVWRSVVGYEGLYEVSNLGRVRRSAPGHTTHAGRILKQHGGGEKGRPTVGLFRDGKQKDFQVHILVAAAFIGPRPEGYEVNHKDGIRANNRDDNLEYVTPADNKAHAIRLGLGVGNGAANSNCRISESDARAILCRARAGEPHRNIALDFGISVAQVRMIKARRRWRCLDAAPE